MPSQRPSELELWRRALAWARGDGAWRSVGDLDADAGPADPEFPPGADRPPETPSRRDLFRLLGAGAALAGLPACPSRPDRRIVPYGDQPPEVTPGVPLRYATSMVLDGFALGLLVESHVGRPTKVEGNPEHPASLGATGVYAQASVLDLYDPQRARAVLERGRPSSWRAFFEQVAAPSIRAPWFVLPPHSSPLVADLIGEVRRIRPGARFTFHAPLDRRAVYAGARAVYGQPLETQYDFRRAARVLALDADFTAAMPMAVRWARDFAAARRLDWPAGAMNRLYQVEPMPSPTGSLADHRLAVRARDVAAVGAAVMVELAEQGAIPAGWPALPAALAALASAEHRAWAAAVARDLAAHRGTSIVIAGDRQPVVTHVIAHLLNAALGNLGATVGLTRSALLEPEPSAPLEELAAALAAGAVDTLIILEGDPVYAAPPELELARGIAGVPRSVHLGLVPDQTARVCRWSLPATHYLEAWGDARAYDGTLTLQQPLIRPLYDGRSTAEVLAGFAGRAGVDGHELLRALWTKDPRGAAAWAAHLRLGLVPDSGYEPHVRAIEWAGATAELDRAAAAAAASDAGLELGFEQSPALYDGRFAHNGWLLELPHPMTKLTWDNAAVVSPRTAIALGIETERVVELTLGERTVRAPVLVLPGHADGTVTLSLGWGHETGAGLARGRGVNAYRLRHAGAPHFAAGLAVRLTADRYPLAFTQDHWRMHGRPIALHATLPAYRAAPEALTAEHRGPQPSWLPEVFAYDQGPQWAMSIDMMICSGCSACMVACQAENNVPIVGKDGVRQSREMHWLRLDRYFVGPADAPEVVNQPMLCQHCEKAPCEYVCPTFATTHSPDGLNEMVYNRCIGTRFCSNNCPYKVRRFNWFEYGGERSSLDLQRNPSVTVRARGVMEKCTYCVQRIRRAGIDARLERRGLRPGEVMTACQQACPTGAIQFGSLMDEDTAMVRWRRQPRAYAVLHELGTRPRTLYLAKISNPNPELT